MQNTTKHNTTKNIIHKKHKHNEIQNLMKLKTQLNTKHKTKQNIESKTQKLYKLN